MGRESSSTTYANLDMREMLDYSGNKKYIKNNPKSEGMRCLESERPKSRRLELIFGKEPTFFEISSAAGQALRLGIFGGKLLSSNFSIAVLNFRF